MAKTFFGLVAIAAVALAAWVAANLVLDGDGDEGWTAAVIDDAGNEVDDDNDDDDDGRLSAVTIVGGAPRLVLDAETQQRAGIVTRAARPATHAARIAATASVLDIAPLIALRDGYIAAAYDAEVVGVETGALEQEYQRLRALYDDDANIALKIVTRAEAAWRIGEARLRRTWARMHALRDRARLEWGAVLADWAFDDKPDIKPLTDRSEALLLVALPLGRRLPPNAETISISHHGGGLDAGRDPFFPLRRRRPARRHAPRRLDRRARLGTDRRGGARRRGYMVAGTGVDLRPGGRRPVRTPRGSHRRRDRRRLVRGARGGAGRETGGGRRADAVRRGIPLANPRRGRRLGFFGAAPPL